MNKLERTLLNQAGLYRRWEATIPEDKRSGEWEFDYPHWQKAYEAISLLLHETALEDLAPSTIDALLGIAPIKWRVS